MGLEETRATFQALDAQMRHLSQTAAKIGDRLQACPVSCRPWHLCLSFLQHKSIHSLRRPLVPKCELTPVHTNSVHGLEGSRISTA